MIPMPFLLEGFFSNSAAPHVTANWAQAAIKALACASNKYRRQSPERFSGF